MTIWILHETLTADEEANIGQRTHLTLPFDDLPDLSMIHRKIECQHLLQALNPDAPPETIAGKADRVWKLYAGLQVEDIIAVPLKTRKELALAEVTGRYEYAVSADGNDIHRTAVKWYAARVKLNVFSKHKELLEGRGEKMHEVMNPEMRTVIRDRLPHSYNRFAKWKWLLVLFFIMGLARRAQHLIMAH